jgi:vacuolar-type H+-ATPase subunit F/Vma7
MSRVAAIGRSTRLAGYALAGVEVLDVRDAAATRAAWEGLPPDVAVVLLTAEARRALPDPLLPSWRLRVVLPEHGPGAPVSPGPR